MTADVSYQPRTGNPNGAVEHTTAEQLDQILGRADADAAILASVPPLTRAGWLRAVADALEADASELADLADSETALGLPRLNGEVLRAASQIRFYADVAVEGSYLQATIDTATATSPALARSMVPLGTVAVFGASNFPFAFSILGNDTASALAAGCPVVAKAHPAHPLSSRRMSELAVDALRAAGAPDGTFAVVSGFEVGAALVTEPRVRAVAFTGSQAAGMHLWRLANQREVVIPVYAEMGTVNPVVVTTAAADGMADIAAGFVGSFTLGSGQFCTKPGLLFAPAGSGAAAAVVTALRAAAPDSHMLTAGIADGVKAGIDELVAAGAATEVVIDGPVGGWSAPAAVLSATPDTVRTNPRLLAECFGPVALVVEYADEADLNGALFALQGALAGSIMAAGPEDPQVRPLLKTLGAKVGRVALGDWPTSVSWKWGQQHGGPWPATTDPRTTSVGAAALDRFVRPVTFQSVPDPLLPAPVQSANPWGVPQRIDGRPARGAARS